jgi:hypothetical protein
MPCPMGKPPSHVRPSIGRFRLVQRRIQVCSGSFASFSFPPRDVRLPSDTRRGSGGARLAAPGQELQQTGSVAPLDEQNSNESVALSEV